MPRKKRAKKTTLLSVTIPIEISETIDKIVQAYPEKNDGEVLKKSRLVTTLLMLALDIIAENQEAIDKEENA